MKAYIVWGIILFGSLAFSPWLFAIMLAIFIAGGNVWTMEKPVKPRQKVESHWS